MKDKLLRILLPIGMILSGIYLVVNRFITEIPDAVAYPMLIGSVMLMWGGMINQIRHAKRNKL